MPRIYTKTPQAVRFAKLVSKTQTSDGCTEWTGRIDRHGYGRFRSPSGRVVQAHRAAWEIANGQIPDGLYVLHTCDNRRCVNPSHLFLGTRKDNNNDMLIKKRGARGEKNGNAKLTKPSVEFIRSEFLSRRMSSLELGKKYGIGRNYVYQLVHSNRWKHV